jgi:hypothetical protein
VLELLAGVTAGQAAAHPLPDAHSIWEIVLHMRVWNEVTVRRIRGEQAEPTPSEDWPSVVESSESRWDDDVRSLKLAHSKAYNAIYGMPDARLTEVVPGKPAFHNFYYELHGLVQHDLYHAGQIALLKKAGRNG